MLSSDSTDPELNLKCLKRSAELGDREAQKEVASLVKRTEPGLSIHYYKILASQGDARAAFNLFEITGYLRLKALGIPDSDDDISRFSNENLAEDAKMQELVDELRPLLLTAQALGSKRANKLIKEYRELRQFGFEPEQQEQKEGHKKLEEKHPAPPGLAPITVSQVETLVTVTITAASSGSSVQASIESNVQEHKDNRDFVNLAIMPLFFTPSLSS